MPRSFYSDLQQGAQRLHLHGAGHQEEPRLRTKFRHDSSFQASSNVLDRADAVFHPDKIPRRQPVLKQSHKPAAATAPNPSASAYTLLRSFATPPCAVSSAYRNAPNNNSSDSKDSAAHLACRLSASLSQLDCKMWRRI
eukprot:4138442-Amphidinium_carterae.1